MVAIGKQHGEHRTPTQQVLHLERVDIGIVGGLVVIEHEIDRVRLGGEEEQLEGCIVSGSGSEGPEDIFNRQISLSFVRTTEEQ